MSFNSGSEHDEDEEEITNEITLEDRLEQLGLNIGIDEFIDTNIVIYLDNVKQLVDELKTLQSLFNCK
jgi:hypothetical protein